jgi:hypothetical protein
VEEGERREGGLVGEERWGWRERRIEESIGADEKLE